MELIGQLTVEVDWLKKIWPQMNLWKLAKPWSNGGHPKIDLKRQADLLSVNRTSLYRIEDCGKSQVF